MYLGVDYYPEQWPIDMLEQDLARMAESNINCIRIAEFAWHLMEPEEGKFDFKFFEQVLDRAHHYGLKVMLGTPTATLPIWMVKNYPEVLSQDEYGVVRHFGGRRQPCHNSPVMLAKSDLIIKKMAEAYGNHPAVYSWQIDNELGHENSDWCYCGHCEVKFREYLKAEFANDINDFNYQIGSVFWSQTYNSFDEIDVPRPTYPAKNPGLMLYFYRFRAQTITSYIKRQVDILRAIVPAIHLITHNYPGDYYNKAQNFTDCAEQIDVVSLNNYPVWGGLDTPLEYAMTSLKLEQTRGFLNGKNFWITEQLIGAQAHTIMGYLPRPGQARLWSWQAMLNGCNSLIYFRWRTATKGAEQFCYGVLDHDNKDGPRYYEMKQVFAEATKYKELINQPIETRVALIYNMDNIYAWKIQPHSTAMNIQNEHYNMYRGMKYLNVPVDVIDIRQDLCKYNIVLLPCPMLLTKEQLAKLEIFMNNGGTVISGYRGGLKDQHNSIYFNQANPLLKLAKLRCYYIESLGTDISVEITNNQQTYTSGVWRDMLEIEDHNEVDVLYTYADEFAKYASVTVTKIGKGNLIYVGTSVNENQFWIELFEKCLNKYQINYEQTKFGVEVFIRDNMKFILNHNNHNEMYHNIKLNPYDVVVINNLEK